MGERSAVGLQGKRVVITRSAEQSRELVRALESAGANAILLSMIAFAPPDNTTALDQVIGELGKFDWIFLTSQNALRSLHERCQELHLDLRTAVGAARIAAVGPATAHSARAAGLAVTYIAAKHQGVALALELAAEVRDQRVLLPRSDRANPELVKELSGLGADVTEVVAYKTVAPAEAALAHARTSFQQRTDAILFFSPSAVHHLQDLLGNEKVLELSKHAIFAAIGPVTETALRRAGVVRVLLAEDTTVKSIVQTLENYFATSRSGLSAGVNPG